jgi:c-di-GMP phosphodiesterase
MRRVAVLHLVVGRQPVFDATKRVLGYELLFRSVSAGMVDGTDGTDGAPASDNGGPGRTGSTGSTGSTGADTDLLTTELLFNSVGIGLDRIVGDRLIFCDAPRSVLTGEMPLVLPPERTVLQVRGTVQIDDRVIKGCQRLAADGYTLAVAGVTWSGDRREEMLDIASFAKVDPSLFSDDEAGVLLGFLRRHGTKVVAERVDTLDDLDRCERLGFDYLQGNVLAEPSAVAGRALDVTRLARLRLMVKLFEPDAETTELESIVRSDPALAHQLLQLAGLGAAGGLRRNVTNLREAIVLVGWRRLQSWLVLLLLNERGHTPEEEILSTLVRARMSELIAQEVNSELAAPAFLAGLVSGFGQLLEAPLPDILAELPLDPALVDAVLHHAGTLGAVVADASDFQLGRAQVSSRTGVSFRTMVVAWRDALSWAIDTTRGLIPGPEDPTPQTA